MIYHTKVRTTLPPLPIWAHVCFERSYLNGPYHSIVDHDLYNSIQVVAIDHSHDPALIEYHHRKVIEDIRKSKAAIVNITCPELNNHTFTNEEPFDILGNCFILRQARIFAKDTNRKIRMTVLTAYTCASVEDFG